MIKIIDLDKLFDKYISDYVYKNIGKIKPEEIEDNMPKMYEKFGNSKLTELEGKTPNGYYKDFLTEELLEGLKEHIKKGIAVSDFLCEAILSKPDADSVIFNFLEKTDDEEFISYLLNLLSMMEKIPSPNRLLEFILLDYGESVKELSTELLSKCADKVKDKIIEIYFDEEESKREYLIEILSNASRDDRILPILLTEFSRHMDKLAQYVGYIVKYGDEKALDTLYTAIENEKIRYADFTELRFAIESLGGEYTKKRDFTLDKDYSKLRIKRKERR